MDDSCAVCAETLEWVAYGACGHRDVCSTCVARLRFICDDRRCCICKTEAPVVFVTKALGDYTAMINDFGVLPSEPREGRFGSYWYHEDTQSFFDDTDHYKMIRAMCKLSCTVCDNTDPTEAPKRRGRFRSVEQLKGHLFHQHKLLMCNLCLEGRKIFICEQKLYTRAQLNQHINTGDSEVDGDEAERGGFSGHPPCDFCKTPFYGDNELYTHMSTEHFTCFICQRQNPGQFDYFKNYDDLEIHFRHDHFLCEDESCLAKKFIVFPSEAEMKRHNTLEHGGRMSRAKRNAALQIPTSFRFRRSSEQDRRRSGRGRAIRNDYVDDQITLTAAINASLETGNSDSGGSFSAARTTIPEFADGNETDEIMNQFESLTTESEQSRRYRQALGQGPMSGALQEAAFPPLAASSSTQMSKPDSESSRNTMADLLRRQTKNQAKKNSKKSNGSSSSPSAWATPARSVAPPAPPIVAAPVSSGPASSSYASLAKGQALGRAAAAAALRVKSPTPNRISHSASAPNLAGKESTSSDFPPIPAARQVPTKTQVVPKVEDVQAANRSLVEKIRAALGNNEESYTAFKEISSHYRQGSVDSETYIDYVQHFGLSHLILDLVRLLPDPEKQRALMDAHNASMRRNNEVKENGWGQSKVSKGKSVDAKPTNPTNTLAESIIGTVRELQSSFKPLEQEVEVLSKDGYRNTKGKSKVVVNDSENLGKESIDSQSSGGKKPKKTSKFHRVRLGEGSKAAILDLRNSDPDPDPDPVVGKSNGDNSTAGAPLRGVWGKGGGNKLQFY